MLKTYYVVLDEYSLVQHEEDGTTALFESEAADKVKDLVKEYQQTDKKRHMEQTFKLSHLSQILKCTNTTYGSTLVH